MSDYLDAHPDQEVQLTIKRGEETFQTSLTPEEPIAGMEDPSPMIGIEFGEARYNTLANPNPFIQVKDSALMVYNTLGALIQQTISPKLLSGPVGIINLYYQLLTVDQGWRLALWFSVILNVNLAILNMLPFPVLDGGHITLSLLEWIRKRPVSMKFLEILQGAFALALIGFMLFITFYDVQDIPVGGQGPPADPVFEEKPGLEPLPEK
jgi:regulator of sigma E protease